MDVSNVTNMYAMFYNATSFNQDISAWDVSSVIGMNVMFYNATSFNQNIGAWDVSSVTDMGGMFESSGLSTKSYDAILTGWTNLTLQQNITLDAQGINYCTSKTARQRIIDTFGWTINDAGLDCDSLCETINECNELSFLIYPNPTNNSLFLKGDENLVAISIYNLQGKKILSAYNTNKINVRALPNGIYIIHISDGTSQTNKKFIKN